MIRQIKDVSIGKQGRDFVNGWVRIDYENGKKAYFADGNALGWSGIFGGTKQLFDAIKVNMDAQAAKKIPKTLKNQQVETALDSKAVKKDEAKDIGPEGLSKEKTQAGAGRYKSRTTAILLSVFFGFWAWIYTWEKDQWKFWTGLGITIITLGLGGIAFYIWALIDALSRTEAFYKGQ